MVSHGWGWGWGWGFDQARGLLQAPRHHFEQSNAASSNDDSSATRLQTESLVCVRELCVVSGRIGGEVTRLLNGRVAGQGWVGQRGRSIQLFKHVVASAVAQSWQQVGRADLRIALGNRLPFFIVVTLSCISSRQ